MLYGYELKTILTLGVIYRIVPIITTHIPKGCGRVMFSQVSVCSQGGGGNPTLGTPLAAIGVLPNSDWGTPQPVLGYLPGLGYSPVWTGVTPRWDWGTAPTGLGYLSWLGYPWLGPGYPPATTGISHQLGLGYSPPPPRQNSRACTCYAVGGMPLAVTQEDFLVNK